MMDQWLDSLSEDWISQPRTSYSNSIVQTPPGNSNRESNVAQSRIPRYNSRSSSKAGAPVTTLAEPRASSSADPKAASSLSKFNSSQRRRRKVPPDTSSPIPESKQKSRRQPSLSSLSSVRKGTVQRQPAQNLPLKEAVSAQSTPEWKRRVLQGDTVSGDHCDLFSPIGLEKVFKPPPLMARTNLERGANSSPVFANGNRSSPLYLLKENKAPRTGSGRPAKDQSSGFPSAKTPEISKIKRKKVNSSIDLEKPRNSNSGEQALTKANREMPRSSTSSISQRSTESMPRRGSNKSNPITIAAEAVQLPGTVSLHVESGADVDEAAPQIEDSYNTSNQEQHAENISPFHISRQRSGTGYIDYVAVDMSMHQLRTQMEQLGFQQNRHISPTSDNGIDDTDDQSLEGNLLIGDQNRDWTSHSLPEGLSAGTDVLVANGGFVNTRRGGYSNEGSFQRRPLSPSSSPPGGIPSLNSSTSPSSSVTRDKRTQSTSPIRPSKLSPFPKTPERKRVNNSSPQEQTRSSGSPLKLFDKHDTFTNERLVRRMSKFEETNHQGTIESNRTQSKKDVDRMTPKISSSKPNQGSNKQISGAPQPPSKARVSSFGDGDLDGHDFTCENYSISKDPGELDKDNSGSVTELDRGVFKFTLCSNPSPKFHRSTKRSLSSSSANCLSSSYNGPREEFDAQGSVKTKISRSTEDNEECSRNALGKRISRSPAKNPQPKRRRTIQRSGLETESCQVNIAVEVKPVVGRKRKDALYDGQSQAADPKILAMRHILRPRMASQNSSQNQSLGAEVIEVEEQKSQALNSAQFEDRDADRPTQEVVADELASFTLDMVQNAARGSRQVSLTTADFFNEAQQIMSLIRAERLPQNSPGIPEESEVELEEKDGLFEEESTKDEFSRPPSRAGITERRQRDPARVDPKVIGLLRQFEDKDDLGIALPPSLTSLHMKQPSGHPFGTDKSRTSSAESDPPNIRILDRRPMGDTPTRASHAKTRSFGSNTNSDPSTGRSLQAASSSGSRTKMVIAPATISHLLSDQMAGMTFDRERQVWVKHKSSPKTDVQNDGVSESTDRDLLGEIPDLSVDELDEIQRIKNSAASFKGRRSNSDGISELDHAKPCVAQEEKSHHGRVSQDDRPRTAEGVPLPNKEESSVESKFSRFTSSGPIPETRATSWGEEALQQKRSAVQGANSTPFTIDDHREHDEEVEHEINILEGRESRSPARSKQRHHQPRVVTVAFSSPLVDQVQAPYAFNSKPESWDDDEDLIDDLDDSPICSDPLPGRSTMKRHPAHSGQRPSYRPISRPSRRVSLENRSYHTRPMSRLDEQDEISFLQRAGNSANASLMVLSTPLNFKSSAIGPHLPSASQRSDVGFHLSPLADFTIHQTDASHLGRRDRAERRGLLAPHEVEGRLALATQNLVKQLTDIEPYEPYWDLIRSIDLHNRGIGSLYMLNEYCPCIEEIDVSENCLEQLDGAPPSIRDLKICRNQLSDMTAWAHLQNLQYLDISNNQIHSLKGFQGLVHLRELVADGNRIESLEGVFDHDGIIRLSLGENNLQSVDFEGTDL